MNPQAQTSSPSETCSKFAGAGDIMPVLQRVVKSCLISAHTFHEQGQSHTAADAESCEPALCASFFHLVEESGGNTHASAADRMAQCNSAAVHIEPFRVEMKIAIAGDHLSSESLIQLDQIDISKSQLLPLQQCAAGTGQSQIPEQPTLHSQIRVPAVRRPNFKAYSYITQKRSAISNRRVSAVNVHSLKNTASLPRSAGLRTGAICSSRSKRIGSLAALFQGGNILRKRPLQRRPALCERRQIDPGPNADFITRARFSR